MQIVYVKIFLPFDEFAQREYLYTVLSFPPCLSDLVKQGFNEMAEQGSLAELHEAYRHGLHEEVPEYADTLDQFCIRKGVETVVTIPFKSLRERWQADPAYRDASADIAPEMDFAFAMADARHRSALSQTEVAERVGTSQAMVARWEMGRSAPTTTSLRRFAETTGAKLRIVFDTDDAA